MKNIERLIIATLRGILRFDRFVLKRYFNLETPLYKFWWRAHMERLQSELDRVRASNKEFEFGRPF